MTDEPIELPPNVISLDAERRLPDLAIATKGVGRFHRGGLRMRL